MSGLSMRVIAHARDGGASWTRACQNGVVEGADYAVMVANDATLGRGGSVRCADAGVQYNRCPGTRLRGMPFP